MKIKDKNFEIALIRRKNLAFFINVIRKSQYMSINFLSRESGVHIYELHRILKFERNKINPFHLQALANVLGINYLWLYQIVGYINIKQIYNEIMMELKKIIKNEKVSEKEMLFTEEEKDIFESIEELGDELTSEDIFEVLALSEELRIHSEKNIELTVVKKLEKEYKKMIKEIGKTDLNEDEKNIKKLTENTLDFLKNVKRDLK